MKNVKWAALAAAMACAMPASAAPILIARGTLGGTTDLSGQTGLLENGLAGNILGGLGSGLTWAGGNRFLALPDRGPNATPYNSLVDDTVSYISRFQSLTLQLTASTGGGLPFTLTPTLTGTTLLSSPTALVYGTGAGLGNRSDGTPLGSGAPTANTATAFYFTGRSDNFAPGLSTNPVDGRFDPESIRLTNNGQSVFISDEYGPYIRQFNRETGQLERTITLPANLNLGVPNPSAQGAVEISGNTGGRTANKGMEGLALTPDGRTLVGIMQAPLLQDATGAPKLVRIVTYDLVTGETHEYGYQLTTGTGVSEIIAVGNNQFLVDERDGKGLGDGSNAAVKSVFLINLNGATDISGVANASASTAVVGKSLSLDIYAALRANGFTAAQVPAKIEGLAFGEDVLYAGSLLHTLYVANDNDFVPGTAGGNQFFVFGFSDADLPGYVQQALVPVPEPSTWAMLIAGFGAIGAALRRRKAKPALA